MDKERLNGILRNVHSIARQYCGGNLSKDYLYFYAGIEEAETRMLLDENYLKIKTEITYEKVNASVRALRAAIKCNMNTTDYSAFYTISQLLNIVDEIIKESEDGKKKE